MQAIFFDFDGVLTTDPTGSYSTCRYVAKAAGVDEAAFTKAYRTYNRDLLLGKTTHAAIWPKVCAGVGVELPYRLLIDSFLHTPLDEGMLTLVRRLKDAGYQTGMITDNKQDRIDCLVKRHHWETLFDAILVSAAVGSGKDGRRIFEQAAAALSVPMEECVFIDNQEKNLLVPRALGMKTVYFDQEKRDFPALIKALRQAGVLC